VLRRVFGPKRDEVMGQWRKLHIEELHNMYSSPDIIRQIKSRRMRWGAMWHAWGRGEMCTGFSWESLRERPLGRPRYRREDGIRMDLREIGWGGVEWIYLADRDQWWALVYAVMKLWVLAPWS
jgi:hypothetical protein